MPTGTPRSAEFGDLYHPRQGALAQARQVFLAGNGLPARWRGREQFVVLETGFGLGNNFLATWQAWRADPERCRQRCTSSRSRPGRCSATTWLAEPRDDAACAPLAAELAAAWPPLTCNLHRLSFDAGAGPSAARLRRCRRLAAAAGRRASTPSSSTASRRPAIRGCGSRACSRRWRAWPRPARPRATWSVARTVREGLASGRVRGRSERRQRRQARDHGRPLRPPIRAADRRPRQLGWRSRPRRRPRRALPVAIVGGGLAGCAAPLALARRGWRRSCSSAAAIARRKARAMRPACSTASSTATTAATRASIAPPRSTRPRRRRAIGDARCSRQRVGACCAWRVAAATSPRCRPCSAELGLPADYVRAVSTREAGEPSPASRAPPRPGTSPAAAGSSRAAWRGRAPAAPTRALAVALRPRGGRAAPQQGRWQLLDASAACSPTRRRRRPGANAGAALDLLGAAPGRASQPRPDQRRRHRVAGRRPRALRLPLAGSGYLLPALDGTTWFGATLGLRTTPIRRSAQRRPSRQPRAPGRAGRRGRRRSMRSVELAGRVGWRWVEPRIGCRSIGPVPLAAIGAELGVDSPRRTRRDPSSRGSSPRAPGLFVFAGLGSRGIARLGARRAGARGVDRRSAVAAGGRPARCDRPGALREPRLPARRPAAGRRELSVSRRSGPSPGRSARWPGRPARVARSPRSPAALRPAFSFSFSSFFFFLASSRWRFSNE